MIVVWPFLPVPWVCLQLVIVVFPGHTHLLFLNALAGDNDICINIFTTTAHVPVDIYLSAIFSHN